MWLRKGLPKRKDPKKIVSALRQAIAGEELVKDSVSGIDLSKLSTEQLYAILKIQDSDRSDDEKRKELAKAINGGIEPISGMRFSDSGEVVLGRKKPSWFAAGPEKPGGYVGRVPSWFHEDDKV